MKYVILILGFFTAQFAFAQDMAPQDFMGEVFSVVSSLGGLSWGAKIIALVTLLISSLKLSLAREMVWDKLGSGKVLVAPSLGLLIGVLALPQLNGPAVMAYLLAGAGSIILHEMLDAVKELPFVGAKVKVGIFVLQQFLGRKK